MGAQLSSKTTQQLSVLDTETITVTRRTPSGSTQNITTIYTGAADIQYEKGVMDYDPAGDVVEFDAIGCIDPVNGVLPVIKSGDFLQITGGDMFTVMTVEPWNLQPTHIELILKRGGIPYNATGHR